MLGDRGSSGDENQPTSQVPSTVTVSQDHAIIEIGPEVSNEGTETPEVIVTYVVAETEVSLGRGQRVKTPSVRLNDFIIYNAICGNSTSRISTSDHSYSVYFDPVTGNTLCPLTELISDDTFSVGHKAFVPAVCAECESKSFSEAMRDKRWTKSVYKEVDVLEVSTTWSVVDLPPGRVALGTMWVFKIKYNADGTVERFKARLLVLGNRQKAGSYYDETFAPIAKMKTVRSLL